MKCKLEKEDFLFNHPEPLRLTQSRWVKKDHVNLPYLIYKTIICGYFLGSWIWGHVQNAKGEEPEKYWIFLTNWGFGIFVYTVVFDFVLVLVRFFNDTFNKNRLDISLKGNKEGKIQRRARKLLWLLTATSYPLAVAITILYWKFIYDFDNPPKEASDKLGNFNVHLLQVLELHQYVMPLS